MAMLIYKVCNCLKHNSLSYYHDTIILHADKKSKNSHLLKSVYHFHMEAFSNLIFAKYPKLKNQLLLLIIIERIVLK